MSITLGEVQMTEIGRVAEVRPEAGSKEEHLRAQLHQFDGRWKGGYFEGDPLDPLGDSTYRELGYISSLYATYLCCIKPYVGSSTIALEIGPGRGAWTKAILTCKPQEVWCLDALSREHNGFDDYVGIRENVNYVQVSDFLCDCLPANHFDYLFSFGCFCHLSPVAIREYFRNLWTKLRPGAHAFVMVADFDKYNRAFMDPKCNISRAVLIEPLNVRRRIWNRLAALAMQKRYPRESWTLQDKEQGSDPRPGRFYHAGIQETAALLRELGYSVLDVDIGTVLRDPIVHFSRP